MSAPDLSHGISELADLVNFQVGAWHDFGYETPPMPDCKPVPPLGERSAQAIRAGHEAVRAIDELTSQLYSLRSQLVGELRQDENIRAARGGGPAPDGILPWTMADDGSHWRAELPDGRTAVIRRVLGPGGEASLLFAPAVYESAADFVAGPECGGVAAAARWVAEHAGEAR